MLKWIGRILLGIVALALLATASVYAASEVIIRRRHAETLEPIAIAGDADAVARGAYMARIVGCDGCHGRNLQGETWLDDTLQGRLQSANLTRATAEYSDAQLARAIRSGVRADGTSLWLMPSAGWTRLSDQDTADIIAWMRSHPPAGEATTPPRFGPLLRLAVVMGKLKSSTSEVAKARTGIAFDAGAAFERGRYLSVTACGECHGPALKGAEIDGQKTPDLIVAGGYSRDEFATFLRTGVAPDGKPRGWMSEIAREHFGQIRDQDLQAIHAYLTARAERMPQG